jgi:hypothetical protein
MDRSIRGHRSIWIQLASVTILALAAQVFAHRPTFSDGSARDPDSALRISDTSVSQVVYLELSDKFPRLWQTFDAQKGQTLTVQIGLPFLPRLKDYRPAVAVIGPGLPNTDLPFSVPNGMGAVLVNTGSNAKPKFFHEPFTNTDSWILGQWPVVLPQTGKYYLVAYHPENKPGKMWVAVGSKEDFGARDMLLFSAWKTQAQRFHEVGEKSSGTPSCFAVVTGALAALGLAFRAMA